MLSELERQREAHRAVRSRLWAKPEPKTVSIKQDETAQTVPVYRVRANVPLGNVVQFPGLIVRPHIVHQRRPLIDDIMQVVAGFYRLTICDLKSDRRDVLTVRARQIVAYLSREMTPLSLTFIGRKLGGKDHTTILHSARRMAMLIRDNERIADEVSILKMKISERLSKWGDINEQ